MLTRDQLTAFIQGLNAGEARPRKPLIEGFVRSRCSQREADKILSDLKSYSDFIAHEELDKPEETAPEN